MITLSPNQATRQKILCTPFEARKFLASFTNYLVVLRNDSTEKTYAFVGDVVYDNERFTQFQIRTNTDDPTNGNVAITESGLYTYTIYGQNSATNLDPTNATVVGTCEVGPCRILFGETAYDFDNPTIPDNVIYYE